jgi:hypothetical protein
MHSADTTDGWQQQYQPGFQLEVPSAADYDNQSMLWNDSLCLVPPYERNRGRPSKKRKAGFLEKPRAQMTCTRCYNNGAVHTKQCKGVSRCHHCLGPNSVYTFIVMILC